MRDVMSTLYQTTVVKAERALVAAMEAKEKVGAFEATFVIETAKVRKIPELKKMIGVL
jgi:hypothetical protein